VVPGTTFTKRMCNRCESLQKWGDVVATSQLALHWKCGFRMPIAQYMKMTGDEHVLGFKSCDISIYWWFWMLSFLLKQVWIGIYYFLLNLPENLGLHLPSNLRVMTLQRLTMIKPLQSGGRYYFRWVNCSTIYISQASH